MKLSDGFPSWFLMRFHVASGKHLQSLWRDPPFYSWENSRHFRPLSMAMLVVTRGYTITSFQSSSGQAPHQLLGRLRAGPATRSAKSIMLQSMINDYHISNIIFVVALFDYLIPKYHFPHDYSCYSSDLQWNPMDTLQKIKHGWLENGPCTSDLPSNTSIQLGDFPASHL